MICGFQKEKMMEIKPGVSVRGLQPEMLLALMIADEKLKDRGFVRVLTSGTEGEHGPGSLHYVGLAGDLRTGTGGILRPDARKLTNEIRKALGGDNSEYDVVCESNHIHIEYQPKGPSK